MKRLNTKHGLILLVLVTLVLIGGNFYFFRLLSKQNTDIIEFAEQLEYEVSREQQLKSVEELVRGLEKEQEIFDSQLIVSENGAVEFIRLVESLNGIASTTLQIGSVSTGPSKVLAESIDLVSLQVNASGEWEEIARLVALLESLPVVTEINNATFSQTGSVETGVTWTVGLNVASYIKK